MTIDFDATIDTGTGAEGLTLTLADPSAGATALGAGGAGEGFGGIKGIAVSLDTYKDSSTDPSSNFIGVATSGSAQRLNYIATSGAIASLKNATHHITVTLSGGLLNVKLDGLTVVTTNVTVSPQVLLGFTASTGKKYNDRHAISHLVVTLG